MGLDPMGSKKLNVGSISKQKSVAINGLDSNVGSKKADVLRKEKTRMMGWI